MALIAQARAEHGPRLFPVLAVIHTGTEMPGDIQGSTAGEHAGLTACAAVQINDHGQTGSGAGGAGFSSRKEGSAAERAAQEGTARHAVFYTHFSVPSLGNLPAPDSRKTRAGAKI